MDPYDKPWLSVADQLERLRERGLVIADADRAAAVLREVGYYRFTGYLHPFRTSSTTHGADGRTGLLVGETFHPGTNFTDAEALLAFDRRLRLLVLEAVERIEVAIRSQLAHTLGRSSPFAHEHAENFTSTFTETSATDSSSSPHERWLLRLQERQRSSDEAFVTHFRERYDGRMPIWAVIEVLEFGQVSRLYGGLRNDLATEIAHAFDVPTKKLLQSWLACLNYVRNVAAHHARLFNRKLVVAPRRPSGSQVPHLAHLSEESAPKEFGTYTALAVLAHLLRSVPSNEGWQVRAVGLMRSFPETARVGITSMGAHPWWLEEPIWADERNSVSD